MRKTTIPEKCACVPNSGIQIQAHVLIHQRLRYFCVPRYFPRFWNNYLLCNYFWTKYTCSDRTSVQGLNPFVKNLFKKSIFSQGIWDTYKIIRTRKIIRVAYRKIVFLGSLLTLGAPRDSPTRLFDICDIFSQHSAVLTSIFISNVCYPAKIDIFGC